MLGTKVYNESERAAEQVPEGGKGGGKRGKKGQKKREEGSRARRRVYARSALEMHRGARQSSSSLPGRTRQMYANVLLSERPHPCACAPRENERRTQRGVNWISVFHGHGCAAPMFFIRGVTHVLGCGREMIFAGVRCISKCFCTYGSTFRE